MNSLHLKLACLLVACSPVMEGRAWAASAGLTLPYTGAPGESNCTNVGCHTSFPVNSGPGGLVLTLLTSTPAHYDEQCG